MANTPAIGTSSIVQQITADADYYEPSIYGILGCYSNFDVVCDTSSGLDFYPLSPTQYKLGEPAQQGKMFVIGILPPVSNISGRALDRSESVASITGSYGQVAPEGETTNSYSIATSSDTPHLGDKPTAVDPVSPSGTVISDSTKTPPVIDSQYIQKQSIRQMYTAMQEGYLTMFGVEPTATQVQFMVAQSLRETDGNWPDNNPGFVRTFGPGQPYFTYKLENGSDNNFAIFNSPAAGVASYISTLRRNPATLQAAKDGDALAYVTALYNAQYFTGQTMQSYLNGFPALLSRVAAAVPEAHLGAWGSSNPGPVTADPSTPGWQGNGANNAQQANAEIANTSGMDLNRSDLGLVFQAAQQNQIAEMQVALDNLKNMPPLRLLVNPNSFKVSSEKICNDGNWTRNGPVVEHWGDGQDKISGSGKLAGFYAVDTSEASGPGLTRTARNWSMAYQNFLSLFLLYRNNGGLYTDDYQTGIPGIQNLSVVGSIYIFFDGILYLGSFDSFNLSEADTSPHTHDYDFAFTVRAWFALDEEPVPGQNYGLVQRASVPTQTPTQVADTAQVAAEARRAEDAAYANSPAGKAQAALDFKTPEEVGMDKYRNSIPTTTHR